MPVLGGLGKKNTNFFLAGFSKFRKNYYFCITKNEDKFFSSNGPFV